MSCLTDEHQVKVVTYVTEIHHRWIIYLCRFFRHKVQIPLSVIITKSRDKVGDEKREREREWMRRHWFVDVNVTGEATVANGAHTHLTCVCVRITSIKRHSQTANENALEIHSRISSLHRTHVQLHVFQQQLCASTRLDLFYTERLENFSKQNCSRGDRMQEPVNRWTIAWRPRKLLHFESMRFDESEWAGINNKKHILLFDL